ncbi:MAG: NAD(P)/FAD-dependent oxidoreductase [Candidatus Thermoplasmatota archaeon]|nr:NAD(P)/FAD-dependent oxidoreductase [Candidatus Thermoplasmatota archaeon]MDA8143726.1 FAD/NAD(P)-binding oxidoreductase [Thermoplasmatales archaeon]
MERKNVLVLGCGIGGLAAANILADKLKGKASITVIDRKRYFQFPPSYPWLMIGKRTRDQVQKDLGVLSGKGINVVNEEITSIDPVRKTVKTAVSEYTGDFLIISLGTQYNPDAVSGFSEYAHHIYDLESAASFRDAVAGFDHGSVAIGISRLPFKCPAAPYEVAFLLDDYFSRKGIRENIQINFYTPEPNPVPSVGPEIADKVLKLLGSRGINYHPRLKLKEVKKNNLVFESGETMDYDLLFSVPPHAAPEPVVKAGMTDSSGWIPVNVKTLETRFPEVFAIEDVASIPTPRGYVPYLPKAGVFAHGQAKVVANNIANAIAGSGKMRDWDGEGACFLETGHGKSAFMKGKFLEEPRPLIDFREPGSIWHVQKVAFEKYWMRHWF